MKKTKFLYRTGVSILCAGVAMLSIPYEVKAEETTDPSTITKKQTVYTVLDQNGNVRNTTVSTWLHGDQGIHNLHDKTGLQNVYDIHTDESNACENGVCVWNSDDNDLYYQGTSDSQLPVSVTMHATFDHEEINMSQLPGKDGHLELKLSFENTQSQVYDINGNAVDVHPLIPLVGGVMLDRDHIRNITVSQGEVISDGSNQIALFMAVPGLKDMLNQTDVAGEADISLPSDEITISCDVSDAPKLSFMMSSAGSISLEDLLTMDNPLDELVNGIAQLSDAGYRLKDGSQQLLEGTQTLIDQSSPLLAAAPKIRALTSGTEQMDDGAKRLQAALRQYTGGVSALSAGTAGLSAIPQGAKTVDNTLNNDLLAGVKAVRNGLTQMKQQVQTVSTSDQMQALTVQIGSAQSALQSLSALVSKDEQILQGMADRLEQIRVTMPQAVDSQALAQTAQTVMTTLASSIDLLNQSASLLPEGEAKATVLQNIQSLSANAQSLGEQFNALSQSLSSVSDVLAGMEETVTGSLQQVSTLKQDISTGLQVLQQMKHMMETMDLTAYTDMQKDMCDGIDQLIAGTDALQGGIVKISEGLSLLVSQSESGIGQIQSAAALLNEKGSALNDGMDQIVNGTDALAQQKDSFTAMADGLDALGEAFASLNDGAKQLYEGQDTFMKDGLDVLGSEVSSSKAQLDELKQLGTCIDEMNQMYGEYDGDNPEMDVNTVYFFRTSTE